ncbi:hypothetical protein I551_4665 [Mycobacterium ulcerans str. Harvey]|uniref:Uncharacterized protein n=1 Tax=Mycobacterium ulcerans str. Harvey TaxID=1299332 RepID=A0ABP3ABW8_MYCUL|nr:hypothetical protein I551_4665 [Mycobacterium ulcerans str. Harvey]
MRLADLSASLTASSAGTGSRRCACSSPRTGAPGHPPT